MASKELLEMLNNAIARELQVSIQYMWQHVQWSGLRGFTVSGELEKIAITEMKHAEKIAERLWYLGNIPPTTKPAPINVGKNLEEMFDNDIKAEEEAIELYKKINEMALKEGDVTTAHIFRDILEDEEEHHDFFTTIKEEI